MIKYLFNGVEGQNSPFIFFCRVHVCIRQSGRKTNELGFIASRLGTCQYHVFVWPRELGWPKKRMNTVIFHTKATIPVTINREKTGNLNFKIESPIKHSPNRSANEKKSSTRESEHRANLSQFARAMFSEDTMNLLCNIFSAWDGVDSNCKL